MNAAEFFDEATKRNLRLNLPVELSAPAFSLSNEALFQLPLLAMTILAITKGAGKPFLPEIGQLVGECLERTVAGFKGSSQDIGWSGNLRIRTIKAQVARPDVLRRPFETCHPNVPGTRQPVNFWQERVCPFRNNKIVAKGNWNRTSLLSKTPGKRKFCYSSKIRQHSELLNLKQKVSNPSGKTSGKHFIDFLF